MTQTTDEIELYRQIMSKDPASQAFVYLAEALWEKEMYVEAIETCINGLRLHPHDLRARVILGVSYLRTGELDRAEAELLKAKKMLEINAVTYQALAELCDERDDSEQAAHYRQLYDTIHPLRVAEVEPEPVELDIEPLPAEFEPEEEVEATIARAEVHVEQGHLDEAVDIYRRILQSSPDTKGVADRLAELERQVAKVQKARNLISILEALKNRVQVLDIEGFTPPLTEPARVEPGKLAALLKNYVEEALKS